MSVCADKLRYPIRRSLLVSWSSVFSRRFCSSATIWPMCMFINLNSWASSSSLLMLCFKKSGPWLNSIESEKLLTDKALNTLFSFLPFFAGMLMFEGEDCILLVCSFFVTMPSFRRHFGLFLVILILKLFPLTSQIFPSNPFFFTSPVGFSSLSTFLFRTKSSKKNWIPPPQLSSHDFWMV